METHIKPNDMEDIIKREAYHRAKALLLDGDESYKIDKVAELLERVSSLTKENEEMMQAITKQDVIHGNDVAELAKLHKEFTDLAIKSEDKNFELSRLREERKEMVEALDVAMTLLAGNTDQDALMAYNHLYDIRYKNNP